jgi:hypothetical protein
MKSLRVVINSTELRDGSPSPTPGRRNNPIPVLFDDTILPTYQQLERLYLCHNVTSPSIFRFLPTTATLKHLSLHSLAPAAPDGNHFRFTPGLLEDLVDSSRSPYVDALETVRIRDVLAEWGENELRQVREAFEARGVIFRWDEDRDSSNGGGSASGSGSGSATGSNETTTAEGAPPSDPVSAPVPRQLGLVDGMSSSISPASVDERQLAPTTGETRPPP